MKWTVFLAAGLCSCFSPLASADLLKEGFQAPPPEARPLTWWHWLNGNVSAEGITLDLEWMKQAGLGGFQLFEGNLFTPEIVSPGAPFLSTQWRSLLKHAAEQARRNGLSMSITTSPGWSAAGGPWVTPQAAMKKLVWSTTDVRGGTPLQLPLTPPPTETGPYQNVSLKEGLPSFYRDSIVLAYRIPEDAQHSFEYPVKATASTSGFDAGSLWNGNLAQPQALPFDDTGRAWLRYDFASPQTVRSISLGLPAAAGFGAPTPPTAILQISSDGLHWQDVVQIPPSRAPERSATFPAVTAPHFRVWFKPTEVPVALQLPKPEQGVVKPPARPMKQAYDVALVQFHRESRVHHAQEKAGFAAAPDYYALDTPTALKSSLVQPDTVVNVTAHMDTQGILQWSTPPGQWRILRMGYSLTGHTNGPAIPEATGLEVDKLEATHVRTYFDQYLNIYRDALGAQAFGPNGLIQGILADSIESGPQNWTDNMIEHFKRLRGYDPVPWLPTLTGAIVESSAASDRFLWDFRKTLADLVSEQYYSEIARIAHKEGLTFSGEALEDNRPQLGDDMAMRSYADVPMGALWALPEKGYGRPTYLADVLGAASVAHIYGQNLTGAEIFGAFLRPWDYMPRDLKATADLALALGVNVFSIHTSVHQPLPDTKPGLALAPFLGQAFTRNETWANQAGPWLTYLARSAYLMRQGQYQADVAYFYGEEAPLTGLFGKGLPDDLPREYGFDFINADALHQQLSVQNQKLVTPSGMVYQVLYLGGTSQHMTLNTLERLKALVEQGATIIGKRPEASPSLKDDAHRFEAIVRQMWPGPGERQTSIGKGQVVSGTALIPAMKVLGIVPDVELSKAQAPDKIWTQHRRLEDGSDLYFLSNQSDEPQSLDLRFRTTTGRPELWKANEGEVYKLPYQRESRLTQVDLTLEARDAVFVIFRHDSDYSVENFVDQFQTLQTLEGDWTLAYTDPEGHMLSRQLSPGQSWTTAQDRQLRYFSGTATYRHIFKLPAVPDQRAFLDLGDVRDLANVTLNGKALGSLWTPPYRIEITGALRAGNNELEVAVTNPWKNRLIGDVQPDIKPTSQTYGRTYEQNAALRPAGLLSPVRLMMGLEQP